MTIPQEFAQLLTGAHSADTLLLKMLAGMEDFPQVRRNYLTAVTELRTQLDDVDDMVSAIDRQATSDLLFAGMLGFTMNWKHFLDPLSPNCTWRNVEYSDCLREDISHTLPEYTAAGAVVEAFHHRLTPTQQDTYHAVSEYIAFLESAVPKLAHYYGYLLGNWLLPRVVPGYRPDASLTLRYRAMLETYLGLSSLPTLL